MNPAVRIPGISASLQKSWKVTFTRQFPRSNTREDTRDNGKPAKKVKIPLLQFLRSDTESTHLLPTGLVVEAYGSKSAGVCFQSCSLKSKMKTNLLVQKIEKTKVKTQNWPPDIFSGPAIGRFSSASYWQPQPGDTPQFSYSYPGSINIEQQCCSHLSCKTKILHHFGPILQQTNHHLP